MAASRLSAVLTIRPCTRVGVPQKVLRSSRLMCTAPPESPTYRRTTTKPGRVRRTTTCCRMHKKPPLRLLLEVIWNPQQRHTSGSRAAGVPRLGATLAIMASLPQLTVVRTELIRTGEHSLRVARQPQHCRVTRRLAHVRPVRRGACALSSAQRVTINAFIAVRCAEPGLRLYASEPPRQRRPSPRTVRARLSVLRHCVHGSVCADEASTTDGQGALPAGAQTRCS